MFSYELAVSMVIVLDTYFCFILIDFEVKILVLILVEALCN